MADDKNVATTGKPLLRISGLPGGSFAWWLWKNRAEFPRTLILTASDEAAQELQDNFISLQRWQDPSAPALSAYLSEEEFDQRATALSLWTLGHPSGDFPQFLIASRELLREGLPSPEEFKHAHRKINLGDKTDRSQLLVQLAQSGYSRVDSVEQVGELAVRGEVLDIWSPGWEEPVRFLWPFDRIEAVRKINLVTQRSTDSIDQVLIRPHKLEGKSDLLSYLGNGGLLLESGLPDDAQVEWPGKKWRRVELGDADKEESYLSAPSFGGPTALTSQKLFAEQLQQWLKDGWRVMIFCHNPGEQERLEEIILEQDRHLAPFFESRKLDLPIGDLVSGFLAPAEKLAVLCNGQLFGRYRRRLRLPKFEGGKSLSEIAELKKGDFVVHERFGVGRYRGLNRVEAGGVEADYLTLEYKGGDRVLVPLFEFRQVQKYIGTEGKKPKLSSIDTATWEKTKEQVEAAVAELAKELLARAAKRSAAMGTMFPPDSHMEKEFGDSFLYDLTPDQAKAINEVKADMISPRPMDRLVCGDVGYGKTEVAMRAAFKAVAAGKQVAVLVPTTILAEQHGRNFRDRFADYPVSIAVLSRFSNPASQKTILTDLRRGVIDVIIGTHRLLSPDVGFKNLGLVIIDEEHRFGVKQKEKIMAFRDTVDVLALSATPIPRTLGASLGGIKALSIIESPPEGRLPIATHVGAFDDKMMVAAVEHELNRGGQVFYVHNRVSTLEKRRQHLEEVLKDHGVPVSIGAAHGQMTGPQLEKIMWEFLHKKYNILLSTSIIESGLDIPSVNTLIVEEAEDFGLSQLYQLRGRVGRERQKAYCYLFYSPGASLSEEAQKRLGALKEFASLGSGFKLALRDLEIRGAGNLLGPQQHGFVNAVGIDLYGQLLTDEIKRQKGEFVEHDERPPELELELPVSAYIPEDYLPSEAERVAFYRRLLDVSSEGLSKLKEELVDRCGGLPDPAERLFLVAELRLAARGRKVIRISLVRGGVELRFQDGLTLPPETLQRLMQEQGPGFSFLPGPPFGMRFGEVPPEDKLIPWLISLLVSLHPAS